MTTPRDKIKTRKDFERFLHARGFSRSEAAGLAAIGYKALLRDKIKPVFTAGRVSVAASQH